MTLHDDPGTRYLPPTPPDLGCHVLAVTRLPAGCDDFGASTKGKVGVGHLRNMMAATRHTMRYAVAAAAAPNADDEVECNNALHPRSTMKQSRYVAFLPGAGGASEFWRPVADRLPTEWEKTLLGWPGAGDQPHHPSVNSFEDLIDLTQDSIVSRSDLIAQSMGGVVAIGVALRYPEMVRRLVLVATSGGLDVEALGGRDWRSEYRAEFPNAAKWVTEQHLDHTPQLARITAPTLLVWGDQDPISPLAVGRRLASVLPNSQLMVLPGGTHQLGSEQPVPVARAILRHLS